MPYHIILYHITKSNPFKPRHCEREDCSVSRTNGNIWNKYWNYIKQRESDLAIDKVSRMRSNVVNVTMYTLDKFQEVPMQEE